MSVPSIAAALAKGLTNDNRGIISKPDAEKIAAEFKETVTSKKNITAARKAYAKSEKFIDMADLAARAPSAKRTLTSARRAAKTHLQDLVDLKNGFATEGEIRCAARDFVEGAFARAHDWPANIDGEIFFDPDDTWHFNALWNITNTLDSEGIPYSDDDNIMMVGACFWDCDADRELVEMNVAVDRVDAKVLGYYMNREFTPV